MSVKLEIYPCKGSYTAARSLFQKQRFQTNIFIVSQQLAKTYKPL